MSAISPTAWLDRLEGRTTSQIGRVPDASHVHELRVACGRLIVWLDLGGWRVLRDDLRWLRRSAATVRDIDVVLERFGDKPWASELAAQRGVGASDLQRAFANPRVHGLVHAIAVMPPVTEEAARRHLGTVRNRTLRAGKRLRHREKDHTEIHRLRRSVRRLRYVLEWIAEAPDELAALQSELGDLNDLVIMERLFAVRAGEDGVAADRVALEAELCELCERIPETWEDARRVVEKL